ncbi:MAG: TIGR00282 family metallophosphoesterase [Sedimentisphaeraceae bacterium JB056]
MFISKAKMKINVLCIGDVVGKAGRDLLISKLPSMVEAHGIDCVIVNAENSAAGSGITPKHYRALIDSGVHIITLGDHAFRKRDILSTLDQNSNIIRPANISQLASGKGFTAYQCSKGTVIGVVVLMGRVFMNPADCPFSCIDNIISKVKSQSDIIIIEVHAEATSEKAALGYYLDGKASLVYGTHTHVQTADEKILPLGTGFITDIGMTGSHYSILGRKVENVVKAMRTQLPYPYEVNDEDCRITGIISTIDSNTKKCEKITRIQVK